MIFATYEEARAWVDQDQHGRSWIFKTVPQGIEVIYLDKLAAGK